MSGHGMKRYVKAGAAAFDRIRPPEPGLVVLEYHRVGGGAAQELDLDRGLFREQMAWLQAAGCALTLDEGLTALGTRDDTWRVVVTFDDGTADFVEHALPEIVAYRIPVTYYIATRFIDEGRPFPYGGAPLSWSGLSEAVATGFVTVGSHTHSHLVMDKATSAEAEEELRRSAGLIEERLTVPARHFAYPKGVYGGPRTEDLIRSRFASAALVNGRANAYGRSDPYRLNRTPVQQSDGMAYFERKVRGGLRAEGAVRNLVDRVRYRKAST